MNITKEINRFRRQLLTGVTESLVKNQPTSAIKNMADVKKVLICRPNQRLGNLLLITPLIQELENSFPDARVDIIVKGGLAVPLFEQFPNIGRIFQLPKRPFINPIKYINSYYRAIKSKYDLVINATEGSSSGRIITQKSKAKHKLFGRAERIYWADQSDHMHIAKRVLLGLREMTGTGRQIKMPDLDLRLTDAEKYSGQRILKRINPDEKKVIAIFTFATGNKMYSKKWWNKLYLELKVHFKDHEIIEILPIENTSQIDFKAPAYYGTDIRELGAVIAACDVFIGSDSGIMHLASAVQVPTVGLFSVTNPGMYQPYNHGSVAIDTRQQSQSDIVSAVKAITSKCVEY